MLSRDEDRAFDRKIICNKRKFIFNGRILKQIIYDGIIVIELGENKVARKSSFLLKGIR